ncbi:protein SIEVE ELEMENT OCCLUSION B-like [Ipomoea triloba]|uniref:protein SIEVE ELEMENT OCCLUSION B-like n=1 Tax=Ipomoea triloba TaxID=35885 RepID=UPI00125D721A|nr:protein SIEVE ELEMENT OCCLUSION B-like [Ipomoea triloba]
MEKLHIDDNAIIELVSASHNPDGTDFDINVALSVAETILDFETIASEWLSNIDGHLITICLLSKLSSYPWEAKLVLMLIAFSISYGKLNIISRLGYKKGLTKQLTFVTQATNPTATSYKQNPFNDSIKHALDLTRCIVELKQSASYSLPQPVISAMPIASYWIGRSVVTNATYCPGLLTAGVKFQNEQDVITTKIKGILATCCPALEEKREEESYKALQHALLNNSSTNVEVLKLILNVNDDNKDVYIRRGERREKTKLKFFKLRRMLLILITSGHDISEERIWVLNSFYSAASLEMLWIPIVDDHEAWTNEQFENLVVKMRFLSMDDPRKQIAQRFIRFVDQNFSSTFHIGKEPVIISLDKQGKIIHSNAMHMMLIWDPRNIEGQSMRIQQRDNIIPFIEKEMKERTQALLTYCAFILIQKSTSSMYTSEREITLWQKEKAWSLGLLLGNIDDIIKSWIIQENHIFLYGGNDAKWVLEFTSKVMESATIKGCALLSKGQKVIVSGYGVKMLRVMNGYQNWTKSMAPESFGQAFKDYYQMISSSSFNSHPYCALEHPTTLKETIENEKCPSAPIICKSTSLLHVNMVIFDYKDDDKLFHG